MNDYISAMNDEAFEEFLIHYGVGPDDNPPGRGSGRYAKGSGENPNQHDIGLQATVSKLKKDGMSMPEIALYLGYTNRFGKPSTGTLRAELSMEDQRRKANLAQAVPKYKASGMSNKAIADKLGISETSVRNYLRDDYILKEDKATQVANCLKEELKTKHAIDIGSGVELSVMNGCSTERMKTAVEILKKQGYNEHLVKVEQMGNPGNYTTIKVLADDTVTWSDLNKDKTLIKPFQSNVSDTAGRESPLGLLPVKSIDSKRVYINYAENGGEERDGEIELRRGVEDISLGKSMYSQVRIGVDDKYYMKGMAIYSDRVPEGYDIIYNTNKKAGTPPEDVFKPMKTLKNPDGSDSGVVDQANPFGASIKVNQYDESGTLVAGGQSYCLDKDGKPTKELRVINKVNDQGDWEKWSKTISAQVLSKQPTPLVKRQLELTYQDKLREFTEYKELTNPTIKRQLLESFADDCDASAAHLKAKAFPGQAWFVTIPIPSLKGDDDYKKTHGVDGEIYAPRYENGTTVAAVRSPHAGTFEIPILRVNNNNKEAQAAMKNAPDAVGLNQKTMDRLSGGDFDGDTVLIIPTTHTNIKSTNRLKDLIGFNTKQYAFPKDYTGKILKGQAKQNEMGRITNLIADMQFFSATEDEIVRAAKHSMVVIDAEKHKLDWKKSYADNNIQELKDKYQNGGGASTLITKAGSEERVEKRKLASVVIGIDPVTGKEKKAYGVDPRTGEIIKTFTGETYMKKSPTKADPDRLVEKPKLEKSKKMYETDDARTLMSSMDHPHPTELAYANYANRMKALALEARKEAVNTPKLEKNAAAAKEYAQEVKDLDEKLIKALKNSPKERQAQILAEATYKNQLKSNPSIKDDPDHVKRLRGQALNGARLRIGAKKERINITDREWEAIQKGAISDSKLKQILNNTKPDDLKKRATPRNSQTLNTANANWAKSMANAGYTLAEIADRLGVSTSTVSKIINQ